MTPVHPGDDGVDALLDRAEVMLSLVEQPDSTSDLLAYAVAASNIALARTVRAQGTTGTPVNPTKPRKQGLIARYPNLALPAPYPVASNHLSSRARTELITVGGSWAQVVEAVRHLVRHEGFDPNKKISAIKSLRQIMHDYFDVYLSLFIAKEIVDHCTSHPGWWDSNV